MTARRASGAGTPKGLRGRRSPARRPRAARGGARRTRTAKATLHVTVRLELLRVPAARRVSAARVRAIARAALAAEGVTGGELSVLVTRDPAIRALNARFRGKDKVTNVLSFPQHDPRAGGLIGDVVLSVDTVARQGAETGAGFAYTFDFYLVHGILHLLGYDHHTGGEAKRMYARTRAILEAAG